MSEHDYKALGLMVGIEIHQQLDSKSKLFCRCPAYLHGTREPDYTLYRKHRPVLGETGKFDDAMLVEFQKGGSVIYEGYYDSTCTYEIDETPPFDPDEECIDIALEIASLFKMNVVREPHVCRKNYVDGSVPAGFQRTMEFAQTGKLDLASGKQIGIQNMFLEEDAARRIKTEGKLNYFRLDRLGIPLVEITTDPDMNTPEEARDASYRIGLLLRSTGKVKRVIGATRQDINISIKGGERIEVKGVQKLDWIPLLIKFEVERQLNLVKIAKEIAARKLEISSIQNKPVDVSKILQNTGCKFIKAGIAKKNVVMGLLIPGFEGIYGTIVYPNRRFGTEVAGKVKVITGLKGLIHSDEDLLGKYHFSETEIKAVKKALKVKEGDLFIMVMGKKAKLATAFELIIKRTAAAFKGVPPETRKAQEDGTHEFLRELSGGARLYPDTDSRALFIEDDHIRRINESLGPYPWDKMKNYAKKYKMEESAVEELIMGGRIDTFDKVIGIMPDNPSLIISLVVDQVKSISREKLDVTKLTEDHYIALITGIKEGIIAKEAAVPVLKTWIKFPELDLATAKKRSGISDFDMGKLDSIIEDLLLKNKDLIDQKGRGAVGPLMGDLMKAVGRGAVDGKVLSSKLMAAINKISGQGGKPKSKPKKNSKAGGKK